MTGRPLAGCVVTARCLGGRPDSRISESLLRPEPIETEEDGKFAIRVVARKNFQVDVRIALAGYWPRTGKWFHMRPGEVNELGEVGLRKGVYATGKVVNRRGQPVVHATVEIAGLPLPLDGDATGSANHTLADRRCHALSGVDGSFRSVDALPPGKFKIRIRGPGLELIQPNSVTVPEGKPMQPVTIIVREPPSISGRVVDDLGVPVAGVGLMARHIGSSSYLTIAVTREDGSFRIARPARFGAGKFRIEVFDGIRCEPGDPIGGLAWRTTGVVIELKHLPEVQITVVEAATGRPVERFGIRCMATGGWRNSKERLRQTGRHEGGRLRVQGVRRGRGKLIVVPRDQWYLPAELEVVGSDEMRPLRVELQRLVPMQLTVRDAKGDLAAHVDVRVVLPGTFITRRAMEYDPRGGGSTSTTDPSATFDTVISKATTDTNGQCIIYGIAGRDDLILSLGRREVGKRITGVAFGPKHLSRRVTFWRR